MLLGQYNSEGILRKHIERYGGTIEFGTELRSFTQHADSVEAVLAKKVGDAEKLETVTCHWLVGSDGARGMSFFPMPLEPYARAEDWSKGIVRKQLGLSFLGETREEGQMIIGLVEVQGLGTEVGQRLS